MSLTPSTIRLDLKCGKGAISEGEKCTKGRATQKANPLATSVYPSRRAIAAGLTAGAVGTAFLFHGSRKAILRAPNQARRIAQRGVTELVHRATAKPPSMRFSETGPLGTMRPPSKTERLHKVAQTANRKAEKAISKAAQAEIERTIAITEAMRESGKAARASFNSGMRRHNLSVEKLRRRYEPGYRKRRSGQRSDTFLTPLTVLRLDGPSTAYYRSHPEARAKRQRAQAEINRRPEERNRRAALNRERRRRGIAGQGGPDVSHTSSGSTVLEDPSKNRARNGAGSRPRLKADSPWATGFDAEDGKKYTKVVTNPETGRKNKVRYGAKGYTIAPGTDKGDRYCARSFGDMKSHGKNCAGPDRNTPLCLSRTKWKCSGKSSRRN